MEEGIFKKQKQKKAGPSRRVDNDIVLFITETLAFVLKYGLNTDWKVCGL